MTTLGFCMWKGILGSRICVKRGITLKIWTQTDEMKDVTIFGGHLENAQWCRESIMQILFLHDFFNQKQQ